MSEGIRCTFSTKDDGGRSTAQETDQDLQHLTNEDRAVELLDKPIYAISTEASQTGIGTLKNADAVNSDCIWRCQEHNRAA